jgi:hypothetical protein
MFISYEYKYLDEKDGKKTWEYDLIDSEFGATAIRGTETSVDANNGWTWYVVMIGGGVIQEYSKRNLNVAANLAVAFVWCDRVVRWWSIEQLIDLNKKYNPLFSQYEKDLQKYLVLL